MELYESMYWDFPGFTANFVFMLELACTIIAGLFITEVELSSFVERARLSLPQPNQQPKTTEKQLLFGWYYYR